MTVAKSKKKRYALKSKNRTALYVESTSSGVVAGVPGAKHPKRPHLTLAVIGKQMDHHIKFDSGGGEIPLGPITKQEMREIAHFVIDHAIPWDPELEYWSPTQKFLDSWDLEGPLPPESSEPESQHIPDEIAHPKLDDPSLWSREKLGPVSDQKVMWGIRVKDGVTVIVFSAAGRLAEMTVEEAASVFGSSFFKALGLDRLVSLLRRKA